MNDIDLEDIPFVALTIPVKAKPWMGDKALIKGLQKKKFKNIISTQQLLKLLTEFKENRK